MLQEKLKEIKQSLRLYMNGVTAQSLREKGLNYHLNWGASLQHLQEMAAEIREDVAKTLIPISIFNVQCSIFLPFFGRRISVNARYSPRCLCRLRSSLLTSQCSG